MKKIIASIVSFTFIFTVFNTPNISGLTLKACSTVEECDAEKAALESKKQDLESKMDGLSNSIEDLEVKLESFNDQIKTLLKEISVNETAIDVRQKDIAKKEKEIDTFERQVMERLAEKQVNQSENTVLSLFVSSTSFTEFLQKWNLIALFNADSKNSVDMLTDKVTELDKEKNALEEEKTQLEALEVETENKKIEATETKKELISQQSHLQGEIDDIKSDQSELDEQKAALANRPPSGSAPGTPGVGGSWSYPTDPSASMVTTAFMSPTYERDYGRSHPAVDIASYGRASIPIMAVNGGTVIAAGWDPYEVFGYRVVISHLVDGVEYVSVYAHMSSVAVSYGQNVGAGEVVGYMGNTGLSYGVHLHIELLAGVGYFDMSKSFRMAHAVDVLQYTGNPYVWEWDAY